MKSFRLLALTAAVLLSFAVAAVAAVRHILRHPHYRFGNRAMWLVISLVILMFGPIIYFVFGRGEEK